MKKSTYKRRSVANEDGLGPQSHHMLTVPADIGDIIGDDAMVTHKQSRFIDEYLIDLNSHRAYRDAGYTGNAINARDLLSNPSIASEIRRRMRLMADRTLVDSQYVVAKLLDIALASPLDVVEIKTTKDQDGNEQQSLFIKDYEKLSFRDRLAVQSISCHHGRVSVTMVDKMRAWEMLARHLGMFTDKVDVTSAGNPITPQVQNIIQINFRS